MGGMVARLKWRFVGLFLLAFAIWLVLWIAADAANWYRSAVLQLARVLSPVLTGWWLEPFPPPPQEFPFFERSGETVQLVINPALLSFAQIPLLSLILATPSLAWRAAAWRCTVGFAAVFLLHVVVVLLYPVLLAQPNLWKDSFGVFLGLLSFVLAPQLLWFLLTYPELRGLWRLDGGTPATAAKGKPKLR